MFKNRGRELGDVEPAVPVKEVSAPVDEKELGAFDVVFGGQFDTDEHVVCTFRVLAEGRDQAIFVAAGWLNTMIGQGQIPDAVNDMTVCDLLAGSSPVRVSGVSKVMGLAEAQKITDDMGLDFSNLGL